MIRRWWWAALAEWYRTRAGWMRARRDAERLMLEDTEWTLRQLEVRATCARQRSRQP